MFTFRYWGWGGEDDDFYRRFTSKGYKPTHLTAELGRYGVRIFKVLETNVF